MSKLDQIFKACDAAGVSIWHANGKLGFSAPRGLPALLALLLKTNKADLLEKIPDGYGWDRGGACVHSPPDPRQVAKALKIELPPDATFDDAMIALLDYEGEYDPEHEMVAMERMG